MNSYRDYYLKDIDNKLVDKKITVSGWVNRSRDHGNLLFRFKRHNLTFTMCCR